MTFSTGIYRTQATPAQIDVRDRAPLFNPKQFSAVQNVFGQGLEFANDFLEKRQKVQDKLQSLTLEREKRAAELAAGGIDSQTAIMIAFNEHKYKYPKTWADVDKQNAISNLASVTTNGWTGNASAAMSIDAGMAKLNSMVASGELDDRSWIDGTGQKYLVNEILPKAETMQGLGPLAPFVTNTLLNRISSVNDKYTDKERKEQLKLYQQGGKDATDNFVNSWLNGDEIDPEVRHRAQTFFEEEPELTKKHLLNETIAVIEKKAWEYDQQDGIDEYIKRKEILEYYGIDFDLQDATKVANDAAEAGNTQRQNDTKEKMEKIDTDLHQHIVDGGTINTQVITELANKHEVDPDLLLNGDLILGLDVIENEFVEMENDIRAGRKSLADGEALMFRVLGAVPGHTAIWEKKFQNAEKAWKAEQRAISKQRSDATLLNIAIWKESYEDPLKDLIKTMGKDSYLFDDGSGKGPTRTLTEEARLNFTSSINTDKATILKDLYSGKITDPTVANDMIRDIIRVNKNNLKNTPEVFVPLKKEEVEQ